MEGPLAGQSLRGRDLVQPLKDLPRRLVVPAVGRPFSLARGPDREPFVRGHNKSALSWVPGVGLPAFERQTPPDDRPVHFVNPPVVPVAVVI